MHRGEGRRLPPRSAVSRKSFLIVSGAGDFALPGSVTILVVVEAPVRVVDWVWNVALLGWFWLLGLLIARGSRREGSLWRAAPDAPVVAELAAGFLHLESATDGVDFVRL